MKNILFIIDNNIQYERIKALIKSKNRRDVKYDFRHSALKSDIWEHEDFINSGSPIIDVNNETEFIIRNFELVISVHCFQFFPKELINNVRCINIHPGFNPTNRGWYPQVFSIIDNLPIGATIHEMDHKLDHGPIIARKRVDKFIWDTSFSIYERVLLTEIELFSEFFDRIINNDYSLISPENEGNIFYKEDFIELCKIDLNQSGTFGQFYDRLRALSHTPYKNAYFIDKETGKKIFLRLDIEHE